MSFTGYKVSLRLLQRRCLNVFSGNTPGVSLRVSSGLSSVAFGNGDKLWQGSSFVPAWMGMAPQSSNPWVPAAGSGDEEHIGP